MDYGSQGISCRLDYLRSVPGILKLIESLCNLLGVILCGAASTIDGYSGQKGFFLFVSILALIVTIVLFALAMLNLQNMFLTNYWPIIELIWCAFIALFYFIASIVIATIAKYNGTYGGAAFFGFAAFITYIADGIFQFRLYRSNAFGQREQQYATNQQYAPNPNEQRPNPTY